MRIYFDGKHSNLTLTLSYLPTPLIGQDMTQGQFLVGFNGSFPAPRLVALPRLKNPVYPTICP